MVQHKSTNGRKNNGNSKRSTTQRNQDADDTRRDGQSGQMKAGKTSASRRQGAAGDTDAAQRGGQNSH